MDVDPHGPEALGLDLTTAMRIAELSEAHMMWATVALSPRGVRRALGVRAARIGTGIALAIAHDPTGGFWSRALAHGLTDPVDDALVAELVSFYRGADVPAAALQIPPALLPDDWEDIAARHGLRAGTTLTKMLRHRGAEPSAPATELEIRGVDERDSVPWAEVLVRGFELPTQEDLIAMVASTVGRDFYAYGAFDGGRQVASASIFIDGDMAAMAGAATLPDARGRGAQSALIAARVDAAVDAGSTWISAETGSERGVDRSASLRNLHRAGFVDMYERRNWVWRPAH